MFKISPTGRIIEGPNMQGVPLRTPEVAAIKAALNPSPQDALTLAERKLREQADFIRDARAYMADRAAYAHGDEYSKLRGLISRANKLGFKG